MDAPAIMSIVGSGTALVVAAAGILRNRDDHKRGVRAENRLDVDAVQARYVQLLDDIDEHSVATLKRRIDELTGQVALLLGRVSQMEDEVASLTTRYRAALTHIRDLIRWIDSYLPSETRPAAPDILTDDL